MGSRTVYSTTITVPVYASWRCVKCDAVNIAVGAIVCKREEAASSMRTSKHEEAKFRASLRAKSEWLSDAFDLIDDPNFNGSAVYRNLFLVRARCGRCRKKPRWNKYPIHQFLLSLAIFVGMCSGFVAITALTDLTAWLIFLACAAFYGWSFLREKLFVRMMQWLPKKYTPVIGSLNTDLIEYAKKQGKAMPNPEECIAAVKNCE